MGHRTGEGEDGAIVRRGEQHARSGSLRRVDHHAAAVDAVAVKVVQHVVAERVVADKATDAHVQAEIGHPRGRQHAAGAGCERHRVHQPLGAEVGRPTQPRHHDVDVDLADDHYVEVTFQFTVLSEHGRITACNGSAATTIKVTANSTTSEISVV